MTIDTQARKVLLIAGLCFLLSSALFTGWLVIITDRVQALETKLSICCRLSERYDNDRAKYELPAGPL